MSKKTSVIALILLIAAAVFLGFILINKGDGPVAGAILSDQEIENVRDFGAAKTSHSYGIYLISEEEFNKFVEKFKADIPAGKGLYANFHMVECCKGTEFTVKWLTQGSVANEETKKLPTDRQGIVSFLLEGDKVRSGSYTLELYTEGKKLFECGFSVK